MLCRALKASKTGMGHSVGWRAFWKLQLLHVPETKDLAPQPNQPGVWLRRLLLDKHMQRILAKHVKQSESIHVKFTVGSLRSNPHSFDFHKSSCFLAHGGAAYMNGYFNAEVALNIGGSGGVIRICLNMLKQC